MKIHNGKLHLRQIGKGFITCNSEGLIGRMLTHTFADQNNKIYIRLNGKIVPLTAQHHLIAAE